MRRFVRWLAGLVGIAALARLLTQRRRHARASAPPTEPDPADELRRKLAEVRASAPAPRAAPAEPSPATAAPTATAEEPGPTLEERRAAIHARAQEAIDAMREVDG